MRQSKSSRPPIELSAHDFNNRLQIHAHPGLLADAPDDDVDFSERSLYGDRPITTCDGGGSASHETATPNHDALAFTGLALASKNDHRERSFEENVVIERGPVGHC
jgi:hypothetical protein